MPLWDVIVSIFWFMVLFTWIWLLITIFGDIFRDHELSGWGKALWTMFLVVIPWLGALVYLIARGSSMNERARAQADRSQQAFDQYVRATAGTGTTSTADELAKLADLRDRGTISAEEFERAKATVLGKATVPAAARHRDERAVAPTT
jgi:Short C-terminal domain/Phospholipase_D-nuclease N-terminal